MEWRTALHRGLMIPAHPLALSPQRVLDERRQRALTRYYLAAGAGGIAVGVHTTQFAIRDAKAGLYSPVLELAMEEMKASAAVRIAGICGRTAQAVQEAGIARQLGYHCGLVSLDALRDATVPQLVEHIRAVGEVLPVFAFYLQPAVGGRVLPLDLWRAVASIESVVAIKVAPFNRYQTLDVLRAVAGSGRSGEIALYTGNDDHILMDLLTTTEIDGVRLRFAGGLLGHWSVWTHTSRAIFDRVRLAIESGEPVAPEMLTLAHQVTDANAALFDAANGFRGCIAGLHEILRRQGFLAGRTCLDPDEDISPGQLAEIDRVCSIYPHLTDDAFVRRHIGEWLGN
ncbi:MAG: dihydrodipicolinate synthase family protein [Acidobacteria bacterium]|nr:dihydrodipicolinate synthase family protein [Acidobacteriota bacterium]